MFAKTVAKATVHTSMHARGQLSVRADTGCKFNARASLSPHHEKLEMMIAKNISAMLLLIAILSGCGRPQGTLDRYIAAKPVVSGADMQPLVAMLLSGDVTGFNRLRTNAPYLGKRLDFRGDSFAGRSLSGANFSDAILAEVDFTGATLDRASFRGSFVATARLAQPHSLTAEVAANIGRPTSLLLADFTGAVLKADEYYEARFGGWWKNQRSLWGIEQTICIGTIGIESLALEKPIQQVKVRVIGHTKSVCIPQIIMGGEPYSSASRIRSALELGATCRNPFLDVETRGLPYWNAPDVIWTALTNLPAVRVRGEYYGANAIDLVNSDPSLVVVLGPDFAGHGSVFSKGPVVVDGAELMGSVYAEGPVWLRNHAFPREKVVGQIIFSETTIEGSQGVSWLSPVVRVPPIGHADTNEDHAVSLNQQRLDLWQKKRNSEMIEARLRNTAAYWLLRLKDPSREVRAHMRMGLSHMDRQVIERMVADPDPDVAKAAAEYLKDYR